MVRENIVTPSNFIYPLFIHDEDFCQDISSMPGCQRHSLPSMLNEVGEALELGVKAFVLFPKVDDALKTNLACEAYNPEGIVHRSIRMIKEKYPEAIVCTDVALDPYSDQGHDGVVEDGVILNDVTVNQLCKQAVSQARAGADIVAPSDMQDGRVKAIRDALDSHPGFGDKKTYQQDPANGREALIEAALDAAEGADMLMVKPGMPYLDIIRRLKDNSDLPIAAYHVSGEYAMLKAAVEKGWLDEKAVVLETLTCFKRAGADIILTYYAKQAAKWIKEDGLY